MIKTMTSSFELSKLSALHNTVTEHLNSLLSPIDSFLEDHILESNHYKIVVNTKEAGFASIHKGGLMTQFVLLPQFRNYGQELFARVKKLEEVQAAFVPTCDEFFLAHALDDYRQITKQAYFFSSAEATFSVPPKFALRRAEKSDTDLIAESSGDFFNHLEDTIAKGRLYLVLEDNSCVAFGVIQKSELLRDTASIGMFVIEKFRKQGVGTATLQLLQQESRRQNLRAVAGCWYYNHLSKKTLERAGMFTQTRLLRIEF
jgi:RimJ/RimL family protein N-acetyltransferase